MKKMNREIYKKLGMAGAVLATIIVGILLFSKHWQFELPLYPNVDELLSLDNIHELMDQHIYSGSIYVLNFFRYPHLTFYYALVGCRILGKIITGVGTDILIRYVICSTAVISNVFMYFTLRKLGNDRLYSYIGFALSVFSLYGFSYLFYTGPDTMLYAIAQVVLYLGVLIYTDENEDRCIYLWYPLIAICIGLAAAAKYHGILFGLFWLILHISKKYYRNYRNNFVFFMCCFVLAVVFCVCNYSMFFHFDTFVGDNLYNLQHYAWGHPGIEHNIPLLGYFEAYALSPYGVVGLILFLLGIIRRITGRRFKEIACFGVMPLFVLIVLSRSSITLGRNLGLIAPFAIILFTDGITFCKELIHKYLGDKLKLSLKLFPAVLSLVIVLFNCIAVINAGRYELSYTAASKWIDENIPEGSKIYVTDYAPILNEDKYSVEVIGEDLSLLKDNLKDGEYFIGVGYALDYFDQKKDFLVCKGSYMYPELHSLKEQKLSGYNKLAEFNSVSYGYEWKYRAGYFDFARYSKSSYYMGPSIEIYN